MARPTFADWRKLKRAVKRAHRSETIARLTQEFDRRFGMGGAIAVYDDGKVYPEELLEHALNNIMKWWGWSGKEGRMKRGETARRCKEAARQMEGMLDGPLSSAMKQAKQAIGELEAAQGKLKKARDMLKTSPHYKRDDGGLKMYNSYLGAAISKAGSSIKEAQMVVNVLEKMDKGAWNEPFKR